MSVIKLARTMPDIANRAHEEPQGTLDWVGMSQVHQPLRLRDGDGVRVIEGRAQIYVDLVDAQAKGIHMSRLYLRLLELGHERELSRSALVETLSDVLASHDDLSTRAFISLDFDYLTERAALKSDNSGYSSYPVQVVARLIDGEVSVELNVKVTYSSTCPCSAALARQLIQEQFDKDFGEGVLRAEDVRKWLGTEQGIVATPHSQRSVADVRTRLAEDVEQLPILPLIDTLEHALQTPVQAAVKREDEQEFALRNGRNLMFCEDAARKLKRALNDDGSYDDFWLRVDHYESLHAHDAVAIVTKGVDGGYLPII